VKNANQSWNLLNVCPTASYNKNLFHLSAIKYAFLYTTVLTVRRYATYIQPVTVTSRRRLRSTSSSAMLVPITRRTTFRDGTFAVAGPSAWNSLPQVVTDCASSGTFRKYLKTYLVSLSF